MDGAAALQTSAVMKPIRVRREPVMSLHRQGQLLLADAARRIRDGDAHRVLARRQLGVGDLNARRGRILGIVPRVDAQVIAARVPLSDMFGYATKIRSISQGRALFTMQFHSYEEVPQQISEGIVAKVKGI